MNPHDERPAPLTRRTFIRSTSQAAVGSLVVANAWSSAAWAYPSDPASRQAMGTRVGEVTDTSAIVWTRLTAHASRNNDGLKIGPRRDEQGRRVPAEPVTVPVEQLEGACPGAAGRVRLRYGLKQDLSDARTTEWVEVSAANDFIHQFRLSGLSPGSRYHYESQTTGPGGSPEHAPLRGRFQTAPPADKPSDFRFCVMTCQGYHDRGHPDGHTIYPSMQALDPVFTCLTGDLVYYDSNEPRAVTPELARYHWQRMFSLPRLAEFTTNVATYWLKDDHDTVTNDSWPGMKAGTFTFEEGLKIFRQQAPMSDGPTYRTYRWGRDLQVWFTEGRDFRSPNRMPDGPDKTIWGDEQKAWFKRTVKESTAAWKVLVSPTPLVGPDRTNKNDNHSNKGFQTEGDEIRAWLKANVPDNFFVICGDRHWQYHSVHPETGLHEFSAGAASDEHAGGTPGEDKNIHRFHRVKGGFLSVTLQPTATGSVIALRHHDIHGAVVHEHRQEKRRS
jgi:alkaline phosphatase D